MVSEPTDFGMTPIETLSYVSDLTLACQHGPFWASWNAVFRSLTPSLEPYAGDGAASGDPGVTHTFQSAGDRTIGCRLLLPDRSEPVALVVMLHGYDATPLDDENPWAPAGLAVLQVRVRGFAGSWFETGDLKSEPMGWICCGLHDLGAWILPDAVMDVAAACVAGRAMLDRFGGTRRPVMLMGESFGGGLAVLAASRLTGGDAVSRLAVGLPSLGAWRWRLAQRPTGSGGINAEIHAYINLHRDRERDIVERLRVCDAAILARRVRCPATMKLAERDDVVPAPAAAAVFNALGTDAGLKHREATRYGHYDGGIADTRLHALWRRRAIEFLDPANDPGRLIQRWGGVGAGD